jgi:hypothetical protein
MIPTTLRRIIFIVLIILSGIHQVMAQSAIVTGVIRDSTGVALEAVTIGVKGDQITAISDQKGRYSISVPAEKEITLSFFLLGYALQESNLLLKSGEVKTLDKVMKISTHYIPQVTVEGVREREKLIIKIDPRSIERIPSVSGSFESVIKTLPGVVSNNELTSTYSVRGGNYDENLVYVNDIEIYRPFLVRSGQQEGLSFINSDLISSISFSAGGFGANYGDKMSSVLDIKYKRPDKTAGSVSMSLLGAGAHMEGVSRNKKFGYLAGFRHKSNQFLLNNLDTKGDYKPSFSDLQALVLYKLSPKTELTLLGNYSRNKYHVIPSDRETEFGSINEALKFTVFFEGNEIDRYDATQGAISLAIQPDSRLRLSFTAGGYYTIEKEYFDIIGAYRLDELEKDLGSDAFGDVAFNRGVGAFLNHARNDLDATVMYGEHRGLYIKERNTWSWGVKAQREEINDKLDEWVYRDSSDFSVPHPSDQPGDTLFVDQQIIVNDVVKAEINLESMRYSGFLQYHFDLERFSFGAGIRATHWDFNSETDVSPRISVQWKPEWHRRLTFRASAGLYYQPPFYRELRNLQGVINNDIQSQRSIHFVVGSDYQFLAWGREFKLTTEAYYKKLNDLIPYKTDNLRLRYLATNNSNGYAYGADMRINGEFVSGIESWASLSFLKTEEDISGDYIYHYYDKSGKEITTNIPPKDTASSTSIAAGYIPRPSDQRFTASIFFQDYLPSFPSYRMHLTLVFGSGLPFGPPGYDRYKDILRMPTYRRVDIGFSKIIIDEDKPNHSRLPLVRKLHSLWFGVEVFNLLQVNNTVSYTWITDVIGRQYAVPNYLSSRLINARLTARF